MQAAGARFGPYEVLSPLGAGGMGEVYRARDTRLGREVALKLLPAGAALDPEKLRRFELEARAAGALNHPNILGILDLGEHEGHPYVVSELLEGETFREKLRVAPFPVRKAVEVAAQIAHGLAAAHDKGIVHRDLKPENLFLTRDGRVKILDFGLAKLVRVQSEDDATRTNEVDSPATESGTVLGTVGYMSPEQVRGLPADQRSDIFSLGAVFFEMVTGRRAFKRETAAETMTAILKEDPPDLLQAAPSAPPALERILKRCLEKSPDERFGSARDLAYAIETLSSSSPEQASRATPAPRRWLRRLHGLPVALAVAALVAALWRHVQQEPGAILANYRFTPVATEGAYEGSPAWSPDGTTLAFVRDVDGVLQVFTRSLSASLAAQLTQAPRDCRQPMWSSDGARVFYVSQAGGEESLWAVSAAGGTPQVVLKSVTTAALSPDGRTLAFLREDNSAGGFFQSLWISSPPGAEPRRYGAVPLAGRRFPEGALRFSPDGSQLGLWLITVWDEQKQAADHAVAEFWVVPFPSGLPRLVPALGGGSARHPSAFDWMPDNRHVVFGSDQLARTPGSHLWMADTQTGRLRALTASNGSETSPAVSPDGRQIAFTSQDEDYRLLEVPVDGSAPRSVHLSARMETDPAWSPRGGQYAFVTERSGEPEIWLRSADGTFERPLVTTESFKDSASTLIANLAVSPDGQRLAYQRAAGQLSFDIWISTLAGGPPVQLARVEEASYHDFPTWSPDGAWVAFTYVSRGQWGLAKARPGAAEAPVIVKEGIVYPSNPRWSPRGDWITCDTPEGFAIVSPDGQASRVLSEENWLAHGWSQDGRTVYAVRQTDGLHMQLTSFDVATGTERVVRADLGPVPPTSTPLRGFSLASDGKSFLTSIVQLRGDIWVLEGFRPPGWREAVWPQAHPEHPGRR